MDEWLSHRSAKPSTAVRIRFGPQKTSLQALVEGFSFFYTHFYIHFYAPHSHPPQSSSPLIRTKRLYNFIAIGAETAQKKEKSNELLFLCRKRLDRRAERGEAEIAPENQPPNL